MKSSFLNTIGVALSIFLIPLSSMSGATFMGLGDLPGGKFQSDAAAVSADGNIVVGYSLGKHGQRAFIWDGRHGMRDLRDVLVTSYDLNLDGWTLKMARAISDDGSTIVGNGINPGGHEEAWMVRLGPVP